MDKLYENTWQEKHRCVIEEFLELLNEKSNQFVLKGGTALLCCYGLKRFSEDIDLDSINPNIEPIINSFCIIHDYSYRIAKDTDTVKRFMINYGATGKPLKIEVSYRTKTIDKKNTTLINGIMVYDIDTLCIMKASAYSARDRIRDLYDLSFICNSYFDSLSDTAKKVAQIAVSYKGVEQFDYVISQQTDYLIDKDELATEFLSMCDKLDVLTEIEEEIER